MHDRDMLHTHLHSLPLYAAHLLTPTTITLIPLNTVIIIISLLLVLMDIINLYLLLLLMDNIIYQSW